MSKFQKSLEILKKCLNSAEDELKSAVGNLSFRQSQHDTYVKDQKLYIDQVGSNIEDYKSAIKRLERKQ